MTVKVSDVLVCAKQDLRTAAGRTIRRMLGKKVVNPLPSKVSIRKIKNMIIEKGFAVYDGKPSWFYTAYDRGNSDPLTNYTLDFISKSYPKDAKILITGCGTGITVFYLADQGFSDITGVDLLSECIDVANSVKKMGDYNGTKFLTGDGFNPSLPNKYDVITALHWVFSAWMGNYGNDPVAAERAREPEFREQLLTSLLSKYVPYLAEDGMIFIELTDAVTDYRIPSDHPMADYSSRIYPVRHTPEQVGRSAEALGLRVVDKKLCVSYGHHPRTLYMLQKCA